MTDPTYAYDGDNNTLATFQYGAVSSGEFEVKSFSTAGAPTSELIAFVDFKIKYTAAAAAVDDEYRIVYWVTPSAIPTILVDWTSSAHSVPTPPGCDVWTSQREPNDDAWSWTDISNIRVVVETDDGANNANDGAAFNLYEVWVTVYAYPQPTLYVDPPTTVKSVSDTFTIDINVTGVNDLYGWEFRLTYNRTQLDIVSPYVVEGPFLSGGGSTWFSNVSWTDSGLHLKTLWYTCTLLGDIPGVTGGGVLATISFQVKAAGSSAFDLHNTKMSGYAYNVYSRRTYDITHTAVDGTFSTSAIPEFPLGAAMEIALTTVIIYVWVRRKSRNKPIRLTG